MKLRIEKAIYGGAGLARAPIEDAATAGKTVFVPMTIPGELVDARISEDRGSFANAELESVLEPAPTRVVPPCPYYGPCGGCHYQHAAYPMQLEMKTAILRETLERARVLTPSSPPIEVVAAEPWGYRNRIRLQLGPASDAGPPALCYHRRGSHALLAVDQCPIAAPILVRALKATQRLAGPLQLDRLCDEIEFFTNAAQDELLLSLIAQSADADAQTRLQGLCDALRSELPQLTGAAISQNEATTLQGRGNKQPRTTVPRRIIARWGEESLTYTAANRAYSVSLGSFFQINRFLVDALVSLVTRGQSGALAWDLYAGAGLFARALTSSFRMVRAVESAPTSCADLRRNLEGTAHKIVESSTLDFLRLHTQSTARKAPQPDLIVVDPPRAGLGAEVTTLLARTAPREIIYVSCDPSTLARDLRALLQSGYQLQSIAMVDLFPQTFHLESVSRLSLR
jgi:23S rRNA (uracil1939-C5)-methyltransferase